MYQRSDEDVISFVAIEDQMRLKTKLPKARQNLFSANADSRKVSEQSKRALQSGVVGFGLIGSEIRLRIGVNVEEVGAGAAR